MSTARTEPLLITPGIRDDLSNDEYHAVTDWWSSSQLKHALPEHYKEGGSQEALDFGTLFHTAVLEPDELGGCVVLDAEKIGVKSDGTPAQNPTMTAAWKRALAEAEADGKTVVAQSDWDKAHAMADAVRAHSTAAALLHDTDGGVEESAFWIDDAGIQHKARFDKRIPGAVIDLKSTISQPGRENLARVVLNYGYDVSAAHYWAVAAGLGLDVQAFALVFVGKTPPHRVTVVELDETFIHRGRVLRTRAIERLTNPVAVPYEGASGYLTLSAPRWAQIEQEIPA
jgi:opacity protein-like surface antigen